jgi:catechol 2,3-dioxygenase-like lactoylglutathione lyase family enzyme
MALMYFVDDVDAEYDRLKTSGLSIEFVSAPAVKPWGVKSFLFKDPDGNEISFLTPVSCLGM